MNVEKNKVVSLIYELRVDGTNGEIVEELNESRPLTFIYGSGMLLPKFENNINGLAVGDNFDFELKCEEAYGSVVNEAIVDIPKHVFAVDGKFDDKLVQVGHSIPMMDGEGNRLNGVVLNVEDETVKMDFNHPLAGDDLYFKGKIVEIREATEEELQHGHIHSNSHSCGCGGSCGDEHGDSCGCDSEAESGCGCGCGH